MLRKKILYVTAYYDGGIGKHLKSLLTHFYRCHTVTLASPEPAPISGEKGGDITYYRLPLNGGTPFFRDVNAMIRLSGLCRHVQPDLIHAHGFRAAMLSLPAAARCSCPVLVTVHNFLAYPEKSVLPASVFNRALRHIDPLVSWYITVSDALRSYLTDCGIEAGRIKTIYNGVPEVFGKPGFVPLKRGYFKPSAWDRRNGGNDIIHIGTSGRLVPQKGMDIFIRAAAQLASIYPRGRLRFYIAGDGPERERLEKLRNSLGLEDLLMFRGKVFNMDAFLAALDIFVLASRSEGLSYSLLEAAATRLPIVAAASGGIPEVITHKKTGLLVPPGDSMTLAWALSGLVENPQTRIMLGTAAVDEVKRRFTEKKMLAQTTSLYRKIIVPYGERGKGKIYLVK